MAELNPLVIPIKLPAVNDGFITKAEQEIPITRGTGIYLNTRNPFLADINVRKALILLFDFEWTNKALFHSAYSRFSSFFSEELEAKEYPTENELAVLDAYKDRLPATIFGSLPKIPVTDASGRNAEGIRTALSLLQESGWKLQNGKLLNAKGEQLSLDLIITSQSSQRIYLPYHSNTSFPSPPSSENWLGTDDNGRDILARILYGFRISVLFGLCLCLFGSVIGVVAGLAQGYYGGKLDLLFQRFMELWAGIPVLYLIIIASSIVVINFWVLLFIMLLFSWMGLVGIVRAESLRVRNMDYIRAAHALGVSDKKIMLRHILPNAVVALIATMPFQINGSIVALTSLDFLGFGLPPHYPSLGEIISQGKNNLYAPWIGLAGFFTLGGMLTSLVLIGEGVRDAFDPRVFLFSDDDDFRKNISEHADNTEEQKRGVHEAS